jgi:hypothetical protein
MKKKWIAFTAMFCSMIAPLCVIAIRITKCRFLIHGVV